MPNITISPTPTDTYTALADEVMEILYKPQTIPNSFEVVNGWLDFDNMKSTWDVQRDHVRPGSMTGGKMVGLTGNLDYIKAVFPSVNTAPGAYTPVPGASIHFRLPFNARAVLFTWQIVAANDAPFGSGKTDQSEMIFCIDGVPQTGQFRVVPDSVDDTRSTYRYARSKRRERLWAGHWLRAQADGTEALTAGWHDAYIAVFSVAPNLRIRIRNMKVLWWR